jgi:hypothetical protein
MGAKPRSGRPGTARAGLSQKRGPGECVRAPARKWRAVGRIEHTLLDGGRAPSPADLRPSPATAPYHS